MKRKSLRPLKFLKFLCQKLFNIKYKTMNETIKADFQALADKNGIDFSITQQVVVTTEETTQFIHTNPQ